MSVSTATTLMLLDSRVRPGTVTLPLTTTIPGRTLTLKDSTGASGVSTITISTSGAETFEDGTTTKTLNTSYGFVSLTGSAGKWYIAAANQVTRAINPINIYGTETLNAMRFGNEYGVVTIFAGNGVSSDVNGTGTGAGFGQPEGIVYDPFSNCLYVVGRGSSALRKVTLAGVVTTVATGMAAARNGVTVDRSGNIYVVQGANTNIINRITPAGVVTVFAGSGATASTDGTGTNAAFNNPYGITCDPTGTFLYVSDASTNKIRRITIAGAVVTTFAGTGGGGSQDGPGTSATFNTPTGLAIDPAGNLYVGDQGSHKVRKITPEGIVTTLAGFGTSGVVDGTGTNARFNSPSGMVFDPITQNLYVADWFGHTIREVTPAGVVTTIAGRAGVNSSINGLGLDATFNQPTALAIDPFGVLYSIDFGGGFYVRRIALVTTLHNVLISTNAIITAPAVSTLTVNTSTINGSTISFPSGNAVAFGGTITTPATAFNTIGGTIMNSSNLYAILNFNNVPATPITGVTTTFAGNRGIATTNGTGTSASFHYLVAIAYNPLLGSFYVLERDTCLIRVMTSAAVVTTLAGGYAATPVDGTGTNARISGFAKAVCDSVGNLYFTDGNRIRRCTPAGVVTTIAGSATASSVNGTGTNATFNSPQGLAIDPTDTNMYICDSTGNLIRRMVISSAVVTTFVGTGAGAIVDGVGTSAQVQGPKALAYDRTTNTLVLVDSGPFGNFVRRITLAGVITTLVGRSGPFLGNDGVGTNAGFYGLTGVGVDPNSGLIYTAEYNNNLIRRITPGNVVTTISGGGSGSGGGSATQDGIGTTASFQQLSDIVCDSNGNVFAVDMGQPRVAMVLPTVGLAGNLFYDNSLFTRTVSTVALNLSSINGQTPTGLSTMISTVAGLNSNISSMIDPTELTSSIIGLGTSGFVSTLGLTFAVASTAAGLGSLGYTSTSQLLSTTVGVFAAITASANVITGTNLTSTVAGLGTTGYISTASLTSSLVGARFLGSTTFLSTAIAQISSLSTVNIQAATGFISSLTVDSLQIGSNAAFFTMGDVLATSISTFQVNTGVLFMNSTFIGNASSQTALQFYGNTGSYSNTVIAEQSTGTGTQELLVFRGSSVSDRIRMQTTGNIVFESGVTARMWPNTPSNATPTLIINSASNVGILTATPAFPLDVAGIARTQTLSSLALNVCTINGVIPWLPIYLQSTVQGLGTATYVSTPSLTSSIQGLGQTYLSTPSLTSTVTSLRASISTIYISAAQIQAGQLSTLNLQVCTINGAAPGTGSGSGGTTFVGSTIFLSAATVQASTLSSLTLQVNTGYVSSLTVDSLQIGSNAAFISLGDSIATSLSTIVVTAGIVNATSTLTSTLFAQSTLLGSSSLQTAIQFFGRTGNYTNTVLAEQSTSGTSQEFLVFRGSSATDRIRMQTTGNIVFEPGVTARMWPNTPSNVTPAMIINTASNIGILTATPAFPLDVAGIVRAQFMSTLNLQVCTINGAAPGTGSGGTTFVGSTIFLSSAQGFISSLTVNALTIGTTAGFTVMGDVIATSLSTINLQVSTINGGLPGSGSSSAFNGSTIAVSTLQLFDPALTFSTLGNLYVRSSLLLYNSTVVAGTRQVQSQMFTF